MDKTIDSLCEDVHVISLAKKRDEYQTERVLEPYRTQDIRKHMEDNPAFRKLMIQTCGDYFLNK